MHKYKVDTTEGTIRIEGVSEIEMREGMVVFSNTGCVLLMVAATNFISAEKVEDGTNN